jgi:signal transduction histidine kinase/ligand-binding sensor domain-containing protein
LFACLLVPLTPCGRGLAEASPPSEEQVVRSWQTKDGLPQNTVNAIVQTRDGYLWVGTAGGLARFDGTRFRAFGLQSGLRSVSISTVIEDQEGVLWVGTRGGGLSRWDDGRFKTYSTEDGLPATVEALAGDKDGNLWIGTQHGLMRYSNGSFTKGGEGLPEKHIHALLVDSKGVLWVSVLVDGIFARSNERFVPVEKTPSSPSGVYSLFEARDGSVWAGGGNGLLWQYRDGAWMRYERTNGLPMSSFDCMAQGAQTPLWIGARNGDLYSFSEGSFHKVALGRDLSGGSIRAMGMDREGTLWVGTAGGGLSRLSRRSLRTWGEADGLQHRVVTSVAEDPTGCLWVATQDGGIYRFQEGRFTMLKDPAVSGFYPYAYTALTTHDGSVWVAGEGFLYRFRAEQPTQAYLDAPVRGEAIRAMCEDGESLWLGTYYSTLLKFDGTAIKLVATNGSFGGGITSLVREAPDTLWIGTANGLYHWDHGNVRAWTTGDGLLSPAIQALHRDSDGTLWIGTLGGGLARLMDGRLVNVTTGQGLADDVIHQIVDDEFGHLWLGCNRGIMRLERREIDDFASGKSSFVHAALFGQSDGMLNEQCTGAHSPTALRTKQGRLLFPTSGGLVEIDRGTALDSRGTMPQPTIEEIKVDGQPMSVASQIVMVPGSGRLEISYDAPSLGSGTSVHFRFRLEPLDKDWVDAGTRRSAFYPSLRPGRYVFRVGASNSQGDWNTNGAMLGVTLQPYYWQTWWFQSLAGLAICGTAFAWYFRRMAGLEKKRAAQEAFTRQLLHSQEDERKRVASELHDGLGQDLLLIKNRLNLLTAGSSHTPEVARQLKEISTSTTRAIADVRAISHALRPSALEQVGFTKAIEWMVEQIGEASAIKFSTELDDINGLLGPDQEINLYRIVQEGLNNVIKHSQASQVILEIKREPASISVSLFDNGRGFDPELTGHNGVARPSFGLTGIRERAKVLGGFIILQSAPGTGTRLTLNVPLGKNGK